MACLRGAPTTEPIASGSRPKAHRRSDNGRRQAFLEAFNLLHDPLPARAHITDVGIQRTADLLSEHRPRSTGSAARCYKHLLGRIASASDLARDPREPVTAVAATLAEANRQGAELRARRSYLSREALLHELLFLHDQLSADQLPDIGWHTWEADSQFTGRDKDLQHLDALLRPGSPIPVAPVVVHGGTGLGKTSLATNYAATRSDTFRSVFINGTTRLAVIRKLMELTGEADSERWNHDLAQAGGPVVPKLPGNSATLIVIDGVSDPSVVLGIVPRQSLCRILITTTLGHLDQGYEHFEITPWSRTDACAFIEAALPASPPEQQERLARILGDHPLAVTQAVNYCQATRRPIEHFLRNLTTQPLEALRLGRASGHSENVAQSIALNIEAAREREPAAFELLALLAQMSSDPFDETLLGRNGLAYAVVAADTVAHTPIRSESHRSGDALSTGAPSALSERATAIYQVLKDENVRERAADTLVTMSLAARRDNGLVVHPLVALIARELAGEPRPWLEVGLAPFLSILGTDTEDVDEATERQLSHALRMVETAMSSGLYGNAVGLMCVHLADYLELHGTWGAGLIGAPQPSEFTHRVSVLFRERALAGEVPWGLALRLRTLYGGALAREGRIDDAETELFAVIEEARSRGQALHQLEALLTVAALIEDPPS